MAKPKIRSGSGIQQVAPRIYDPVTIQYLNNKKLFSSKNYAGQKALEMFPYVREIVLDKLKGTFNEEELLYLIEVFELDKIPNFVTSVDALENKIKEKEKFTGKNNIDLSAKIKNLDDLKAIFLSEWITSFLYLKEKVKKKEYVERLL